MYTCTCVYSCLPPLFLSLNYEDIAIIVILFDLSQMPTKKRSGVYAILKIYLFTRRKRESVCHIPLISTYRHVANSRASRTVYFIRRRFILHLSICARHLAPRGIDAVAALRRRRLGDGPAAIARTFIVRAGIMELDCLG